MKSDLYLVSGRQPWNKPVVCEAAGYGNVMSMGSLGGDRIRRKGQQPRIGAGAMHWVWALHEMIRD